MTCELSATSSDAAAAPDLVTAVDAAPLTKCYGTGLFTTCMPEPNTLLRVTTAVTIDTSTTCDAIVDGACVWARAEIIVDLGARIDVTGSRPLVLLGAKTIAIAGVVDGASKQGGKIGPGAGSAPCTIQATPFTAGGAGGSFAGRGGDGGNGEDGNGIASAGIALAPALRAGCAGQSGGQPKPGGGGAGGGAIYLVSGNSIAISGRIDVSGAGGTGGAPGDRGAGGGGGSGGFIALDAPSIEVTGALVANGGGGAEGGGSSSTGNNGGDGGAALAAGGANAGSGGDGGSGSFGIALRGGDGRENNSDEAGGGGGGGGAGVIRVFPIQVLGGTAMPPAY
jgi:hypothetical protein